MAKNLVDICDRLQLVTSKTGSKDPINNRGDTVEVVFKYQYNHYRPSITDIYVLQFVGIVDTVPGENILIIAVREGRIIYLSRCGANEDISSRIEYITWNTDLYTPKYPHGLQNLPMNYLQSALLVKNTIGPTWRKYFVIHLMNQVAEWFPMLRGYGRDLLRYRMRPSIPTGLSVATD